VQVSDGADNLLSVSPWSRESESPLAGECGRGPIMVCFGHLEGLIRATLNLQTWHSGLKCGRGAFGHVPGANAPCGGA
jgi:hypothetical protein